jgi:hypothetical protein
MILRLHQDRHYLVNYTGGVVVYVYPLLVRRLPRPVKLKLEKGNGVAEVDAYYDDQHGWYFKT